MKSRTFLAALALCSLPSCDKVRNLAGELRNKIAASPATAQASPGASDIPKDVRDMLPARPGRIVIVDYYADWCGPCRQLSPVLEKIAAENSSTIVVCKVNVDKFNALAAQEGVHGIPDVRIFQDGKLVEKFVGALPEATVRERIEPLVQHLPPLPPAETEAVKPKSTEPTSRPMPKDWMPPGIKRR